MPWPSRRPHGTTQRRARPPGRYLGEQLRSDLSQVSPQRLGVIFRGVDDHRVLQPEPVHDLRSQIDIDQTRVTDLDANQPAVPGNVEEPRDLEPAQAELARDLDLGPLIQEVPARHQSCEGQAGGPRKLSGHQEAFRSNERRVSIVQGTS